MKDVFRTKKNAFLAFIGEQARTQRTKVFKEDETAFAKRLAFFWGVENCSEDTVRAIEAGLPEVPVGVWASVWLACQVSDQIASASKADAALYLAAVEMPSNIEKEIAAFNAQHKREKK